MIILINKRLFIFFPLLYICNKGRIKFYKKEKFGNIIFVKDVKEHNTRHFSQYLTDKQQFTNA